MRLFSRLAIFAALIGASIVGYFFKIPSWINIGVPLILVVLQLISLDRTKIVILILLSMPLASGYLSNMYLGGDFNLFFLNYSSTFLYVSAVFFGFDNFAIYEVIHLNRLLLGQRIGRNVALVFLALSTGLNTINENVLSWKDSRKLASYRQWSGASCSETILENIAAIIISVFEAANSMWDQTQCWRK